MSVYSDEIRNIINECATNVAQLELSITDNDTKISELNTKKHSLSYFMNGEVTTGICNLYGNGNTVWHRGNDYSDDNLSVNNINIYKSIAAATPIGATSFTCEGDHEVELTGNLLLNWGYIIYNGIIPIGSKSGLITSTADAVYDDPLTTVTIPAVAGKSEYVTYASSSIYQYGGGDAAVDALMIHYFWLFEFIYKALDMSGTYGTDDMITKLGLVGDLMVINKDKYSEGITELEQYAT